LMTAFFVGLDLNPRRIMTMRCAPLRPFGREEIEMADSWELGRSNLKRSRHSG